METRANNKRKTRGSTTSLQPPTSKLKTAHHHKEGGSPGDALLDCDEDIPCTPKPSHPKRDLPGVSAVAGVAGAGVVEDDEHMCHPDELLQSGLVGVSLDDREMLEWMYEREEFYQPDSNYFAKASIKPQMRAKVVDWLQHVSIFACFLDPSSDTFF
jgi:hypothetical protein